MKLGEDVIGVIRVDSLFPQKRGFNALDHELFTLLSEHCGPALLSAALFAESRRRGDVVSSWCEPILAALGNPSSDPPVVSAEPERRAP